MYVVGKCDFFSLREEFGKVCEQEIYLLGRFFQCNHNNTSHFFAVR
jgi:hypothetical protein